MVDTIPFCSKLFTEIGTIILRFLVNTHWGKDKRF